MVFAASSGLSGVAELLPTDRRRLAIVLRATPIGLLVALIAVVLRLLLS
ncbi:hypothetical protein [Haloterrigena thermotolerans]